VICNVCEKVWTYDCDDDLYRNYKKDEDEDEEESDEEDEDEEESDEEDEDESDEDESGEEDEYHRATDEWRSIRELRKEIKRDLRQGGDDSWVADRICENAVEVRKLYAENEILTKKIKEQDENEKKSKEIFDAVKEECECFAKEIATKQKLVDVLEAKLERTETYKKFLEKENGELKIKNRDLEERITIALLKVEANKAFMKAHETQFADRFEQSAELHRVFLRKDMAIDCLQDRVNALEEKLALENKSKMEEAKAVAILRAKGYQVFAPDALDMVQELNHRGNLVTAMSQQLTALRLELYNKGRSAHTRRTYLPPTPVDQIITGLEGYQ
jgi:hypothetical protein